MFTRSVTPDTFFDTALPALEEILFTEMDSYPDIIPIVMNYKPGRQGWGMQTTEQSGLGPAVRTPEGSSILYDDPVQGNQKTFVYQKFALGVKTSDELIEDDQWDQAEDLYRALGQSMFHTRQQTAIDNFNNGFTANGYDGVPLFSTSHPLVKAGGTEANRPTVDVDLSVASLRAALTQITNWLDHNGLRVMHRPKYLLLSTTDIYQGIELLESDYRPDTANNAVNAFTPWGIKPITTPYLTDTDAWFIICEQHKLMFLERKAPTLESFRDFDAQAHKTSNTSRWDTGHSSWYGLWGSRGA